jgi:dynein heavy chain 1
LPRLTVVIHSQIDRLNLEGYANLEHWVAELDKRIEGILLQRLVHIIQVWCAEFDRTDDGDTRREAPVRETFSKRRGDKRLKEEKARIYFLMRVLTHC